MHLYDLPACLVLISSAFVCVVVHVTQKGYPIQCFGDTFKYPFWGTLPSLGPSCPHQWKGSTGCGHLHCHPLPVSPAKVSSHRQRLSGTIPRHRGGQIRRLHQCHNHVRPRQRDVYQQEFRTAHLNFWKDEKPDYPSLPAKAPLVVVWSTKARILPMVAKIPNFPL